MKTVAELLKLKAHHHGEVHTVTPEHMVIDALKLMAEQNIGAVPVLSDGRVVGILSERDYARKLVLKGLSSIGTPVRDIMTDMRLRHLPVVDEGKLIGLLSIGDLVKEAIAEQAELIKTMEQYIRGEIS